MFGLPALGGKGGSSNFHIEDSVKNSINHGGLRSIVVVLEAETLKVVKTLKADDSLENDFARLRNELNTASIVLFNRDKHWAMLAYTPAGTGVKMRTMLSSCHGQLKALIPQDTVKVMAMIDKEEDCTAEKYQDTFRSLTEEERLGMMSIEERQRLEVDADIAKEQASQPQRMIGLSSVRAPVAPEWLEKVKSIHKGQYSILEFGPQLTGSFENGLEKLGGLKGKLKGPSYVVWQMNEKEVLVALWSASESTNKQDRVAKMSLSSYKSDFIEQVRGVLEGKEVVSTEAHDDDDLETFTIEARATNGNATQAAPKFKPPPGAMAMPGMTPFKLPGM